MKTSIVTHRPAHRPVSIDAKRVNVSLDQQTIEAARSLGGGNLSAGIRLAVDTISRLKNDDQISRL